MNGLTEHPSGKGRRGNLLVWAALSVILVLYVFSALRTSPTVSWAASFDTGLFLSTGKALASGQGFILPSFPGHLPSMKYPELYPLLLAGVWKLDPHFPENVGLVVGVSLGFGCLALLVTFLMLRRWPELGDWPSLGIVLLIGVSQAFVYQSTTLMSDTPFMALMLAAAWLAEVSADGVVVSRGGRLQRSPTAALGAAAGAGVLAGMCVGIRSAGIPVAAGIGLLLLFRRQFKKLFWFCLTGLPLTLYWSWPTVAGILGLRPPVIVGDPTRSGWTQTVCFYSSYACIRRISVPNFGALKSAILPSLRITLAEPGIILLRPLAVSAAVWISVLVTLLGAAAYVGTARSWRENGCRPLYAIFPLYLLLLLAWPFMPDRFLIPFAPLYFAGLWFEGKHMWGAVRARLKQDGGKSERVAAYLLGLLALGAAAVVAVNLAYLAPRAIGAFARQSGQVLADERGAYTWIRKNAAPSARIIALTDGLTYLYTGRESIHAIYPLTDNPGLTEARYVQHDANHLGDVARQIRASYWLTTPYDYPLQTSEQRATLLASQAKLLAGAPVVYRSADGLVTLYDTRWIFGVTSGSPAPASGLASTPE